MNSKNSLHTLTDASLCQYFKPYMQNARTSITIRLNIYFLLYMPHCSIRGQHNFVFFQHWKGFKSQINKILMNPSLDRYWLSGERGCRLNVRSVVKLRLKFGGFSELRWQIEWIKLCTFPRLYHYSFKYSGFFLHYQSTSFLLVLQYIYVMIGVSRPVLCTW